MNMSLSIFGNKFHCEGDETWGLEVSGIEETCIEGPIK